MEETTPCPKRGRADALSPAYEASAAHDEGLASRARPCASLAPLQPLSGGITPIHVKGPGGVPASAVHGASAETVAAAVASVHAGFAATSASSSSSSSAAPLGACAGGGVDGGSGSRCRVPLLALEAIIGAGKSTLLDAVQQHFGASVVVVPEPVGLWSNVDGHNLLGEYYKDQKV
jgi:hypothetical protein